MKEILITHKLETERWLAFSSKKKTFRVVISRDTEKKNTQKTQFLNFINSFVAKWSPTIKMNISFICKAI